MQRIVFYQDAHYLIQVLVYAAFDIIGETPSYKEFADEQYFLTIDVVNWYENHNAVNRHT